MTGWMLQKQQAWIVEEKDGDSSVVVTRDDRAAEYLEEQDFEVQICHW